MSWSEISQEADISAHTMSVDEATRRVRALSEPDGRPPVLSLSLRPEARSGNIILRTSDLRVGFPDKELFAADDIELRRLECAALIGPNGAGKTTFLKTILGQRPPLSGEVSLGASLQIGYFAQAHEDLRPERSLVEEIESAAPGMLLAEIRSYLARFLFTGEDVFKRVQVLSGGSGVAWRLPSWPLPAPTCCCWTSRPTTWISPPRRSCKRCWLNTRARSCWSRTTAT
jgi:ATP-binding cassette, subfamily F, member 3